MPSPEPSPLLVRAPGAYSVMTDELLAHLPVLARLADELEADGHRLAVLSLESPTWALREKLDGCERRASELADRVRRLRAAIGSAEVAYSAVERTVTSMQDAASDWMAGMLLRPAVPSLLPWFLVGAAAIWQLPEGTDAQKREALGRWLLEHPEVITNPEFVTLVRRLVTGADDLVLGNPLLMAILGDHGFGLLGVGTSAAAISGLAALAGTGVLTETPVRADRLGVSSGGVPPAGAADRLRRVPGEKQVRIERYSAPGQPDRFVVYVAPTQTFSPIAVSEPWDFTSNVVGVAGLPSGSIRATEQAMADAGIRSDSPVVLVGYSQGGLVADVLAGSGHWNVSGLETYGDPGGGIAVPPGTRGFAARHTDDFIPATGGPQQTDERMILATRAYPDSETMPKGREVPAHQKDAYEATARAIDAARSDAVRDELRALNDFTGDYTGRDGFRMTTFEYRAERVSGSS